MSDVHTATQSTSPAYKKPSGKKEAPEARAARLNLVFDASLNRLMNEAQASGDWLKAYTAVCAAYRNNLLRERPEERFLAEAPKWHREQLLALKGQMPRRSRFSPSPLGNKTMPFAEANKRREANRAERIAAMPAKGKAGQKSEPHGKKGKGKK